jgi:superfamily II DNA or RNA helicase
MKTASIIASATTCLILNELSDQELTYLTVKTRFHPSGYMHQWMFKTKKWDGYTNTFDRINKTFRIGLLHRVTLALNQLGYTVQVDDQRSRAMSAIDIALDMQTYKPYDYQDKVREIVRKNDIGIIAGPCGSGKSVQAGIIIDELKTPTLFLTNDLVLTDQMYRNMGKYFPGKKIGYIGDGEFELGDVTVSTVQSLASIWGITKSKKKQQHDRRQELDDHLKTVRLVLHDEAHTSETDTCIAIYDRFKHVVKRFGFSATPKELDGEKEKTANIGLEQIFGEVIYSAFDNDFYGLGVRVPLIVKSVEVPYVTQVYGGYKDNQAEVYRECLEAEILLNPEWHHAIEKAAHEFTDSGNTVFVYAGHRIEYGETIAKMLGAPFVQGKTKRADRFKLFDDVYSKKIKCIVSDIGGVGLDIRSLDAIIIATDMKDIRQIAGRVVRSCPEFNKECGYIVDLYKQCSFLKTHRTQRLAQYKAENALVL